MKTPFYVLIAAGFIFAAGCKNEPPAPAPDPVIEIPAEPDPDPIIEPTPEPGTELDGGPVSTPPSTPPIAGVVACAAPPQRDPMMHEVMAAFHYADAMAADVCAVKSGLWSNGSTWSTGVVPGANQDVWIPPSVDVSYDSQAAGRIGWLLVDGGFKWTGGRSLTVDTLIGAEGGSIDIGSIGAPATFDLVIAGNGPLPTGHDSANVSRGTLFFGHTAIVGASKTSRVRVAQPPLKGQYTVMLAAAPNGWQLGDKIVVAGTRITSYSSFTETRRRGGSTQDEARVIAAINGATITLDKPLLFNHDAPQQAFADGTKPATYVVNLSRSVTFRNENGAATPKFERGHILTTSTIDFHIRSVAIEEFGRTDKSIASNPDHTFAPLTPTSNVKGRYALHLHKAGYVSTKAQRPTVTNIAVNGSPGWGIAQHDMDADLTDNVVFNAWGSGIVAERGGEKGDWIDNTVIKTTGRFPCSAKSADSVNREDLANCGEAVWISRLINLKGQVVAGVTNSPGVINMTRLPKASIPVIPPERLPHFSVMDDEQVGVDNDRPPIREVADYECFAAATCVEIIKANPLQRHNVYTVFNRAKFWNLHDCGMVMTYTSGYVLKSINVVNDPGYIILRCGIEYGKNNLKMAAVAPFVSHAIVGVTSQNSFTFTPPADHDVTAVNLTCDRCRNRVAGGVKDLRGSYAEGPPKVTLTGQVTTAPVGGFTITVPALVTDALGQRKACDTDWDVCRRRGYTINARLPKDGWCQKANGKPAYDVVQAWSDRLSGQLTETHRLLELPPAYDAVRAASPFNGPCP